MNWENCFLRPAGPEEGEEALELIRRRIAWMDERDIDQWNRSGYLNYYPLEFFQREARLGRLYFLDDGTGRRVACAVLLEEDGRWPDRPRALYIHNLASAVDCPGAGEQMILRCVELARSQGREYVRLDCPQRNRELNAYYERLGFQLAGGVDEDWYVGNLRQYRL